MQALVLLGQRCPSIRPSHSGIVLIKTNKAIVVTRDNGRVQYLPQILTHFALRLVIILQYTASGEVTPWLQNCARCIFSLCSLQFVKCGVHGGFVVTYSALWIVLRLNAMLYLNYYEYIK